MPKSSPRPAGPKVDAFLRRAKKFPEELKKLRAILLGCELTEELKWRSPCYCFQGANVAIIGELKDVCVLSFFKGALLKDPRGILNLPGENTQAARTIRLSSLEQIAKLEPVLEAYIHEAIELEKSGQKVDFEAKTELVYPEELTKKLDEDPTLRTAFEGLTPGRQRSYILHFSAPKQAKTRESRIEKSIPDILAGKGFNEDYVKKKRK